jgi:cell division protein FtsB
VDQPIKPIANAQGEPVPVRAANDPQLSFFAHLGGLVLLIVQDVFGTHGVLAMHRSQVEANRIKQEIQQLDQENQKLQNDVTDLKSDPATIEGCARGMGYARKGEVIFKLPQKAVDSACPVTPPSAARPTY